ncbi:hypothetical protein SO802_008132 [Lithocarpus litseifolius]|uniref:Bulb-type lectin domain-containing protein n=1 Tax=Lithocarpus litseifolius TaxID=425828 RepID=A0AAW2D7Q9_9ROSI
MSNFVTKVTSSSSEFSFGFRRFQINEKESQFLLAIWFTKTKDQTIVWSANGNEPAPQGSTLMQNSSSAFVLNDPNGKELWKAPGNGSKSSCAAILDNGNLVILDEQYNSIWESFKEPTDTILPGQILYMNTTLKSHQSTTNYSYGRFHLSLQLDGNLVLYYINMPSEVLNHAYFATMTIDDAFGCHEGPQASGKFMWEGEPGPKHFILYGQWRGLWELPHWELPRVPHRLGGAPTCGL